MPSEWRKTAQAQGAATSSVSTPTKITRMTKARRQQVSDALRLGFAS